MTLTKSHEKYDDYTHTHTYIHIHKPTQLKFCTYIIQDDVIKLSLIISWYASALLPLPGVARNTVLSLRTVKFTVGFSITKIS
jgi:hypothetical protein